MTTTIKCPQCEDKVCGADESLKPFCQRAEKLTKQRQEMEAQISHLHPSLQAEARHSWNAHVLKQATLVGEEVLKARKEV